MELGEDPVNKSSDYAYDELLHGGVMACAPIVVVSIVVVSQEASILNGKPTKQIVRAPNIIMRYAHFLCTIFTASFEFATYETTVVGGQITIVHDVSFLYYCPGWRTRQVWQRNF